MKNFEGRIPIGRIGTPMFDGGYARYGQFAKPPRPHG
jgi:hypothetical protein